MRSNSVVVPVRWDDHATAFCIGKTTSDTADCSEEHDTSTSSTISLLEAYVQGARVRLGNVGQTRAQKVWPLKQVGLSNRRRGSSRSISRRAPQRQAT